MAAEGVQEGYGFLYPKKNREGKQPLMTGKAKLDGREIEIAAWPKVSGNGVKYLSLRVQNPQSQQSLPEGDTPGTDVPAAATADDDMPF